VNAGRCRHGCIREGAEDDLLGVPQMRFDCRVRPLGITGTQHRQKLTVRVVSTFRFARFRFQPAEGIPNVPLRRVPQGFENTHVPGRCRRPNDLAVQGHVRFPPLIAVTRGRVRALHDIQTLEVGGRQQHARALDELRLDAQPQPVDVAKFLRVERRDEGALGPTGDDQSLEFEPPRDSRTGMRLTPSCSAI
jgi:hypothetical protein